VQGQARRAPTARRDRRGRSRGLAAGPATVPPLTAPSALLSGRRRPKRHRRRRLSRAGLALARARLGQGPLPLLRGSRREGLADRGTADQAHTRRADEVKTFRRTCINLPEAVATDPFG